MIGTEHLPDELLRDIRNMRTFSTAFKINIACERPPQYTGLRKAIDDGALGDFNYPNYVHCAPDIDYLEKAYDDAKHGWYSHRPFMTPVVPTVVDDSLAPAGKHVVNLFGGHAPYELKDASWADERDNFTNTVFDTLDGFAPGFTDDVIATEVLLGTRHRGPGQSSARPYLPRRTGPGSALLQASRAPLRGLPGSLEGPLHVRIELPSRRRRFGHPRPQRREGDSPGPRQTGTQPMIKGTCKPSAF